MASFVYPKVFLGVMFFMYSTGQMAAQAHKTYFIDLDTAPTERWLEVGRDNPQMGPIIKNLTQSAIPKEIMPLLKIYVRHIDRYLPEEYVQEFQGLSNASGVPMEELVISNLIFEMIVICTSILCQDPSGHIWHARNLDYTFTENYRNLVIFVEFQRQNKTVYRTVSFAGYIGALTGEKVNAYTVSFDQRETDRRPWMQAVYALLNRNAATLFVTSRQVLDSADTYADAVEQFSSIPMMTPIYIIVGGAHPGEGVVISRMRTYIVDMWFLDPFNGRWFMVETNYDHWLQPPKDDDRRNPAIHMMNEMGQQNISTPLLMEILMHPNITLGITVTSTVYSASQPDVYSTYVWK